MRRLPLNWRRILRSNERPPIEKIYAQIEDTLRNQYSFWLHAGASGWQRAVSQDHAVLQTTWLDYASTRRILRELMVRFRWSGTFNCCKNPAGACSSAAPLTDGRVLGKICRTEHEVEQKAAARCNSCSEPRIGRRMSAGTRAAAKSAGSRRSRADGPALRPASPTAPPAVVGDAIDANTARFDEHFGFLWFPFPAGCLFLPMQSVDGLFRRSTLPDITCLTLPRPIR
jgi:hypothetical protein